MANYSSNIDFFFPPWFASQIHELIFTIFAYFSLQHKDLSECTCVFMRLCMSTACMLIPFFPMHLFSPWYAFVSSYYNTTFIVVFSGGFPNCIPILYISDTTNHNIRVRDCGQGHGRKWGGPNRNSHSYHYHHRQERPCSRVHTSTGKKHPFFLFNYTPI